MLLAIGPLASFTGFIQILLWIIAPILAVIVLVTIILHYRRKRSEADPEKLQKIVSASPESSGYKIDDDQYVLFDHSGIIREYKTRLVNNHARYTALKQDFEILEDRYNSLLIQTSTGNISKKENMESLNHPDHEVTALIANEQESRYEDLNRRFQELQIEKENLLAKVAMLSSPDPSDELAHKLQEENRTLRDKIAEQDYLRDIVEEKKAHIDFLQQQLDQRIKNFHLSEQRFNETKEQLERARINLDETDSMVASLKNEILSKQEEVAGLRERLTSNERILGEKESVLLSKMDQVTYLENLLREMKEQNEMLQAALSDTQEKSGNLEQLLEDERSRIGFMEQKLVANKQLMLRLYNEFAACMEESPVVSIRQAVGQ